VLFIGGCQNKLEAQNRRKSFKSLSYIYADQDKDGRPDHLGEEVTVTGIASVKSGLLDSDYLESFIQNGSTGLLIYHNEIKQPFNKGDSLVVSGTIRLHKGRVELNATSYEVFSKRKKILPKSILLKRALNNSAPSIGVLVHGEARVVDKGTFGDGKYLTIKVSGPEGAKAMVFVSKYHALYSKFKFGKIKVGDTVVLNGILGGESQSISKQKLNLLYLRTPKDLVRKDPDRSELSAQKVSKKSNSLKPISYVYSDKNNDGQPDHLNEVVTVSGIANIKSGLFHPKYLQAFIQNDSTGLSIFNPEVLHPFNRGDSLVVTGEIQQYEGLTELYVTTYRVFSKNKQDVVPKPISLEKALLHPKKRVGVLVHGEGIIIDKGNVQNGKYLKISVPDSTRSKAMVYVSNFHILSQDFKFDVLDIGDTIKITGILGELSQEYPNLHLHKIYLRKPNDLNYAGIPRYYLIWGVGLILLVAAIIAGWIISLRQEVKNKTAEIQKSLDEKEILLREIHHRVKNNLSIISGLIELQLDSTEDDGAKQVLKDSQSRIHSMAMIHEKLYEKESLSGIKVDEYLRELVEAIHGTFTEYKNAIELQFDMDSVSLDIDKVVPCGLLINEIVVNTFKHAFKENKHGILKIQLKKENEKVELTISDNGPGLPEDFTLESTDSLGGMLISTFANQLGAETEIFNKGGAVFRFTFSKD